ncbi:DUF6221 family protein [Kitasatospora sp. NPDC057692]|uniref:DUF6221 family protein n=1 Tax=Kitasatospora sp. NPDC057692 TaxID=3346215 RepID=UPI0036995B63
MTADLVAFLRARLDEDEQGAATSWPGLWATDAEEYGVVDSEDGTEIADIVVCSTRQQQATARHIARHHPARVLAEVDAKRRILARYTSAVADSAEDADGYYDENRFEDARQLYPVLRLLALPYADHPGYRPEWAPDA